MLSLLMLIIEYLFFFFKQKTAYEMRISDWSSDVCSSDLTDRTDGADRAKTHAHSADRHARRQVLLGRRRSGTVPWPEVWRLRPVHVPAAADVSAVLQSQSQGRDRKSTRLNSSH